MRKLILGLAVTLDGYIEGPNGEYDWCFTDQDYGLSEFYERIDALFIGRKSYQIAQMHSNGNIRELIPNSENVTAYVFSNTLKLVKEGEVLLSENAIAAAKRIKNLPGKDIWLYGGAELSAAMMKENLIDELWLSVHPILIGRGKALFPAQDNSTRLRLLESKTYETGLVSLRYEIENN